MSRLKSFYQGKDKAEKKQALGKPFWITIAVLVVLALVFFYLAGRIPTSPGAPGQDPYAQTIGPQGKRVFVDPDFAFSQALIDYADGFAAIRREFKLILPINKYNFQNYMIYGWQLTTGSDEEKRQAGEISKFLDIYENSFPDE
jgi:hypothetical protein